MKFCQADGTILVADEPSGADDPFKTVLANQPEEPQEQESDFDPMKTMLAAPPTLDAPPPSPFGEPRRDEPKDTGMNAPSFGDVGSPQFNESPLPSESYPQEQRDSGGFGQQQPSGQFGNEPTFKEPESPFGNQPKFGGEPFGNQQNEWSAPPAPQGWGNQGLGQNTPFNAPPIKAQGANQTLPLISLITGIVSIPCCYIGFIVGAVALVTGFLGMGNIKKNPNMYGGKGLAMAGMITGGIGVAIWLLYWLFILLIVGAGVVSG